MCVYLDIVVIDESDDLSLMLWGFIIVDSENPST
jgi:hypothetical protein